MKNIAEQSVLFSYGAFLCSDFLAASASGNKDSLMEAVTLRFGRVSAFRQKRGCVHPEARGGSGGTFPGRKKVPQKKNLAF